jgi:hypothetical protein
LLDFVFAVGLYFSKSLSRLLKFLAFLDFGLPNLEFRLLPKSILLNMFLAALSCSLLRFLRFPLAVLSILLSGLENFLLPKANLS